MNEPKWDWQVIADDGGAVEAVERGVSKAEAKAFARLANMGSDGPYYFAEPWKPRHIWRDVE